MQETEKLREEGASQLLPEGVRGRVAVVLAERKYVYFFSFIFFLKHGLYLYNLIRAASIYKNRIFLLKTQPRLRNNPVQTNSRSQQFFHNISQYC